jgi:integrase
LIASGLDIVFVRGQLGHAHPGITLQVYSHTSSAPASTPQLPATHSTRATARSTATASDGPTAVVTAVVTPDASNGLNVVFVSRQLGHANANITLEVYAHLYARADHADTARAALDASYAAINGTGGHTSAPVTAAETVRQ